MNVRQHLAPPRTEPGVRQSRGRVEFRARPAGAAFYIDPSGIRWRIYDCVLRRGRLEHVYLESDAASYRVFVDQDGRQEAYFRGRREPFTLSPMECDRQLREAKSLGGTMRLELR